MIERTDVLIAGMAAYLNVLYLFTRYGSNGTFNNIVIVIGAVGWAIWGTKMLYVSIFRR